MVGPAIGGMRVATRGLGSRGILHRNSVQLLWKWRSRGGGVGCLSCISSMFPCVVQSADGAEDRQKRGVFCMLFSAGIKFLWSNTKALHLKLSMAASNTTVGSASLDGAEDMPKKRCVVHATFLQAARFCGAKQRP